MLTVSDSPGVIDLDDQVIQGGGGLLQFVVTPALPCFIIV
jgi:hypothetical protein